MKPVLVLYAMDSDLHGLTGSLGNQVLRVLNALKIPHDCINIDNAALVAMTNAQVAARWSVAICSRVQNDWGANHYCWMNGTRGIPVVIGNSASGKILNNANVTTGATAAYATNHASAWDGNPDKADEDARLGVDADGNEFYIGVDGNYFAFDLDPADPYLTPIISHAYTSMVFAWKREAPGRSPVVFFGRLGHEPLWVLEALKLSGEKPVNPMAIRIDCDDIEQFCTSEGIRQLAAWLRERNAVCISGLIHDDATYPMTVETAYTGRHEIIEELPKHTDVLKWVLHDDVAAMAGVPDGLTRLGSTGTVTYGGTVYDMTKVDDQKALHALRCAECTAAGWPVTPDGYLGHMAVNNNLATFVGQKALGELGVRVLRLGSNNHRQLLGNQSDSPIRVVCGYSSIVNWYKRKLAGVITDRSASEPTIYGFGKRVQTWHEIPYRLGVASAYTFRTPIVYFHANNFDYGQASGRPWTVVTAPYGYTVIPTTGFGGTYMCTTPGASGAGEPDWTTAPNEGDTIVDGAITWTRTTADAPGLWILDKMDSCVQQSGGWLVWAGDKELRKMSGANLREV